MKLLMVQLPTSQLGAGEIVYPLGLSRLSSLVPGTVEKVTLDMNICQDPWQSLKEELENFGPDTVALSFRNLDPLAGHQASYLSSLKSGALLVRTLLPEVKLIGGGPAFSLFGRRLMEEVDELDIGLVGEGELVFRELLQSHPLLEKIPGIIWRRGSELIVNPSPAKINMDELPPLDLKGFSPTDYVGANSYVAAMGIEGKRGCDLWCGYCLYPFLGGTCMRLRSPKKIVDEMEILQRDFGINLFHFTDAVVNRPRDHFEAVCRELINRDLKVSWTGFFRENDFTRENLALAVKAGLVAVYFSGDALNQHGLALLNKKMSIDDLIKASRLTSEQKVLTMCHFLVNLPWETEKSLQEAEETLDELLEIHGPAGNLGAVIFNHVRLYPGAPLTRKLLKSGELNPNTDLLYPVYYNPEKYSHVLHKLEAKCHSAGIFSRLELKLPYQEKSI